MVSQISVSKRLSEGIVLAVVAALILLAFELRLHNLDAFSFWTDEGLTPLRSGYPIGEILSNRITIQEGVTRDTHPPFYYLIVHFTQRLFGQTDFAYRYPSLLAGVLLVPMLFQFGRRLQNLSTGLFTALFTAVNPLQIYYADEARMYTLLVLLVAGASYVLWCAVSARRLSRRDLLRSLLLYFLLAGLAFYTHYTAVFLIAAQALFWVYLLWREGYRRLIVGLSFAAFLLAVPVIPFTVPRFFSGAEADYFYVQPQVMLMDVLRFFTLGLTVNFNETLVSILLVVMFILALTGLYAAGSWMKRLFLLAYLLAVVFGLMAGSLVKPMYQGVRHIMAGSPAMILLLALGADYLLEPGGRLERKGKMIARLAGSVLVLATLFGAFYAIDNLYNDPTYAKDDLRGLIRYVERRAGKDDIVLYNNAILLPLHEHYRTRQDLPATALPVYPHNADGVEEQLTDLASSAQRIWFVTDPPADDRDKDGRVHGWLAENLQDVDNESFHARTTVVNSIGYRSAPAQTEVVPQDSETIEITWPGVPALLGIAGMAGQSAGGDTLWIDLFWNGNLAPPPDSGLRLWMQDGNGGAWAEYEQSFSDNFTNWPSPGVLRESYKLPLPAGLPEGNYTLMALPLEYTGQSIGEAQQVTALDILPSPGLPGNPAVLFENGLRLQALDWYDSDIHPGHNMSAAIFWQTEPGEPLAVDNLHYEVDVIAPDGQVVRTLGGKPVESGVNELPADTAVRQRTDFYFPADSETGQYRLRWRLYDGEESVRGRSFRRPWTSEAVNYASIHVTPWPLNKSLPQDVEVVEAWLGSAIQLYGYEMGEIAGGVLPISLYWLVSDTPEENYLVFIHLVNVSNGEIAGQADRIPLDGLRPTAGWRPDEVLRDDIALPVAQNLEPGEYAVNVGMYNPESGERLPLVVDGQRQPNDQLTLFQLVLP
jgi:mannosyltransferase